MVGIPAPKNMVKSLEKVTGGVPTPHMGVSLNGGTPNLHPKMIIFSRKTPWLLGSTIWGNTPYILYQVRDGFWSISYFSIGWPCTSGRRVFCQKKPAGPSYEMSKPEEPKQPVLRRRSTSIPYTQLDRDYFMSNYVEDHFATGIFMECNCFIFSSNFF